MSDIVVCQEKLMYLAGGITGLSYEEAVAWRQYVEKKVPSWLKVMSPMRSKEFIRSKEINSTVKDHYSDNPFATPKAIITRDRNDCKRSNCLFVNFLKCPRVSIGTVMEVAWADAYRVPIVIVMEKDNIHQHSMICESAGYIVDDLDEGIHIAIELLRTGN